MQQLIRALERARQALGWSQKQTAESLGIPLANYRRWLGGQDSSLSARTHVEVKATQLIKELRKMRGELDRLIVEAEKISKRKES